MTADYGFCTILATDDVPGLQVRAACCSKLTSGVVTVHVQADDHKYTGLSSKFSLAWTGGAGW